MKDITQFQLLSAGARNLSEFGYSGVTTKNVATDPLFRRFFIRMLDDTLEKLPNCKAAKELKAGIEALNKKEGIE